MSRRWLVIGRKDFGDGSLWKEDGGWRSMMEIIRSDLLDDDKWGDRGGATAMDGPMPVRPAAENCRVQYIDMVIIKFNSLV